MARTKRKAKIVIDIVEPTAEQMDRDEYELSPITERGQVIGAAFKKRRQLERLFQADVITPSEYGALLHYRNFADMADKSPVKDSLDRNMPQAASSGELPAYILDARFKTGKYESAAGSLWQFLRDIVVNDMTLTRWVIENVRSYEAFEKGRMILKARPDDVEIAKLGMRIVARRVMAEIDA